MAPVIAPAIPKPKPTPAPTPVAIKAIPVPSIPTVIVIKVLSAILIIFDALKYFLLDVSRFEFHPRKIFVCQI